MATMTGKEYIESLRKMNPEVYIVGERVENLPDHPLFKPGISCVAATYDAVKDYPELATFTSPYINEPINPFTHIWQCAEDGIKRVKLTRKLTIKNICVLRCISCDMINGAWATTYDLDQKYGTTYHERLKNYVKEVQKKDLFIGCAILDVKGDRSRGIGEQDDPDMHLHVVEKKSDGVVVRGCKANTTCGSYTHELFVSPSDLITREDQKDYAVTFAIPTDTKGVKFIGRPPDVPREAKQIERPVSQKAGHVEHLTIFDDVFVPRERVFMCGEWEMANQMLFPIASNHLMAKCGCKGGQVDLMVGAAALVAEYNGVDGYDHIKNKLCEMKMTAELGYSCAITSVIDGAMHPSGVYLPATLPVAVGKYLTGIQAGREADLLMDICGGLVVTMPTEKDWNNPDTRPFMEKYLKAKPGVSTENRIKAIKLAEDLSASAFSGWFRGLTVLGALPEFWLKKFVELTYDTEERKKVAREFCGIKE